MKQLLILVFALNVFATAFSQGIRFEQSSWPEVLDLARRQNKPIFVDAYTDWCVPCKRMAAQVFVLDSIGEYFNNTFINVQMDMEKGEGIEFAKKYDVNAFPTLLYFDAKGKLSFKAVGAKDAEGLMSQARMALDPQYQLATYEKNFLESERTLADILFYARKLTESGSYAKATELVAKELDRFSESELISLDGWQLISYYINHHKFPEFEFVVANRKKFQRIAGDDKVDRYIFFVLTAMRNIGRGRGTASYQQFYDELQYFSKYFPVDYFIARARYFEHLQNEDSIFYHATNLFDREYDVFMADDKLPYFMIYMANKYISEKDGKRDAAYRWAKRSWQMDSKDYKAAYILAQLYAADGNKEEALKWGELALERYKPKTEAKVITDLFNSEGLPGLVEKLK